MNYDFNAALAKAQQDCNRFQELLDAQYNIDMIQAQFEHLQKEHGWAMERAKTLEVKAANDHMFKVMMDIVNEHETVREAFEDLLAVMKLADPEVEAKMNRGKTL